MSELRECPFCGKEMQRHDDCGDENTVWCGNCGAIGPNDLTPALADRMWNLRRPEDSLRAKIQSMLHEVQKYQPVGSPPPGDETMLVRWIMDTLRAENAKLREDITGYRRTVSKQHSDLARLRELLGEALERIPHWQRCAIFDNPEEQCDCGRSDIQYRIQSELKE